MKVSEVNVLMVFDRGWQVVVILFCRIILYWCVSSVLVLCAALLCIVCDTLLCHLCAIHFGCGLLLNICVRYICELVCSAFVCATSVYLTVCNTLCAIHLVCNAFVCDTSVYLCAICVRYNCVRCICVLYFVCDIFVCDTSVCGASPPQP